MAPLLNAKVNVIQSFEIVINDISGIKAGVENMTHAEIKTPAGKKENIYIWVYPKSKYKEEKKDIEWMAEMKNQTISLPENLQERKAVGIIYQKKRYLAVFKKRKDLVITVKDGKIADVNGGQLAETFIWRWLVGYTDDSWDKEEASLVAYLEANGVITEVPHITLDTDDLPADDWMLVAHLMSLTNNVYLYQSDGSLTAAQWEKFTAKFNGKNTNLFLSAGAMDKASGKIVAKFVSKFKMATLGHGFGGLEYEDFSGFVKNLEACLEQDDAKCKYLNMNKLNMEGKDKVKAMGERLGWKVDHIYEPKDDDNDYQIVLKKN